MKVYSKNSQAQFNSVKPETINDNVVAQVQSFNGKLDGQNMPVESIDNDKLLSPQVSFPVLPDVDSFNWYGETQSYHQVRRNNVFEGGISHYLPILSFDMALSDWSSGWNPVTELDPLFAYCQLNFDAQDGMITGCVDVDFRHGTDLILDSAPVVAEFGDEQWMEWGVFVNGVLIAETGRVYPRLENLSIPYKVPCGTQPITVELKWKGIALQALLSGWTEEPLQRLEIYQINIWANNNYK